MKLHLLAGLVVGVGLWCGTAVSAVAVDRDAVEPPQISAELAERLEPLIAAHPGEVSVAIKHLGTGVGFTHREAEAMPTASLIKLAVMVTAYEQISVGKLQLDQLLLLNESDKVPGSGILTPNFSKGTQLTLRDAIRLMIAYSDNTATNLVVDAIGLPSTAEHMSQLGFPNTKLHSKVYRRDTSIFPERSQQSGLGSTTAAETISLLEKIDLGRIISRQACDQMLEHLYACEDRSKLARLLPRSVRVAHKSGYVSQTRVDAGLIDGPEGRIAICVLTDKNEDQDPSDDNAASQLISNIAATTYRFFYPRMQASSSKQSMLGLEMPASGPVVQTLQRTLNDRLQPSPRLAVDGEFGPATQAALMAFQRSRDLAATGIVDEATFKAIGTSAATASNAPVPAVENDADSEPDDDPSPVTAKAETFDGPPVVSCRAWAIGDVSTGKLLHQHEAARKLDNASTTKLMTAWLVAKLARQHPEILDEELVFSERADKTSGSTAGIEAGEKLRVGDLLYGLLLPSGNDAAVALAEHFGARIGSEAGEEAEDAKGDSAEASGPEKERGEQVSAYDRFIDGMNREAAALELTQTSYKNPHGLTANGHGCSAGDLVTLARHVLEDPVLSKIVSVRRYRCDVTNADGSTRKVSWTNTNRLLEIEGYDGAKTGTTTAAGACLVASGNRHGKRLIVVVLGASGSEARYADARNLFRWAWQQPAAEGE
jgi:serine-type D-Ala-D-Ala carboxypeptidase (penicillin-binding protein 5/6)